MLAVPVPLPIEAVVMGLPLSVVMPVVAASATEEIDDASETAEVAAEEAEDAASAAAPLAAEGQILPVISRASVGGFGQCCFLGKESE